MLILHTCRSSGVSIQAFAKWAPPQDVSRTDFERELRWSQGMGVVSDNWIDCVSLSILYMLKPSCWPMFIITININCYYNPFVVIIVIIISSSSILCIHLFVIETLMSTDARTPFLGTPLVPPKPICILSLTHGW